ncbi:protein jag [Peptoniphilus sp. KCTC 25270]|uniref:RNA-binding cell elongation regulator Jag/EloR n=1 Tax=Peptoniphilus sp. KCTC 25270 TaxID=2897414 RepID=UPI001E3ABA0B|nr:RNA-binding cell elongation regulator Jag/EloR [Peptoniphilus sp. KCTC 25270]MCD1147906.1 protein jag [Peptoniphilus sp. KCTC 25270]
MTYSIQSGKSIEEAIQKALNELRIHRDQAEIEIIEEPSKGFLGLIGGKEAIVKVTEKLETKDILNSIFEDDFSTSTFAREEEKKTLVEEIQPVEEKPVVEEKSIEEEIPVVEETSVEAELENNDISQEEVIVPADAREEAFVETEKEDLPVEEKNRIIEEYIAEIMEALSVDYTLSIEHKDRMVFVSIDGKKEETGIIIGKRGATLDAIQYILSLILNNKSDVFTRVIVDCSNYREKREATLENLAKKMAKKVLHSNRPVRLEPMNAQERRIIHASLGSFEGVSTHSEGKEPYRRVVIQKERKY